MLHLGAPLLLGAPVHHEAPVSLETLAYKYGTDKSKDDHKYVDLYHSLFHDRRHRVHNLTELGVSSVIKRRVPI